MAAMVGVSIADNTGTQLLPKNTGEAIYQDQDGNTHYLYLPQVMESSECSTTINCEMWWDGKGCEGVIENMRVSGWLRDDMPVPD
jgi:hypothetical protein